MTKTLINTIKIRIRFSEVDSLKVVWHGHYLKYFEDGREAFGRQYGIGYMDFFANGIIVPLVHVELNFKKFLKCGEEAIIETRFIDTKAAKIKYAYTIFNNKMEIVATGKSIQAFLDKEGELMLCAPQFFIDWKKKWGITNCLGKQK